MVPSGRNGVALWDGKVAGSSTSRVAAKECSQGREPLEAHAARDAKPRQGRQKIAVKVIDERGNELMAVKGLGH